MIQCKQPDNPMQFLGSKHPEGGGRITVEEYVQTGYLFFTI